jgi:cyclase
MLRTRVIPVLLVQDHGLVKTTKFESPKYVGDPINAIRIFNEKEVDELALLDISASPNARGPNFALIEDVASECFMPLSYGGGIQTVEEARRLFSLGVEKVVIRSAAMNDLRLVSDIACLAGSSSVVVSLDIKKTKLGRNQIFAPGTRRHKDQKWVQLIEDAIIHGAGEILLNVVDKDGTMSGMDVETIRIAAETTQVPLVAVGGVGSLADIRSGVEAGANAIGVGSFFVYHGPRRAVLITYPSYDELTELLGDLA